MTYNHLKFSKFSDIWLYSHRYFIKRLFWSISQNSQKNTCAWNTPSTSYYEACQARYFMNHSMHAILWSMRSTAFYEARQARNFVTLTKHTNFLTHAKHVIYEACQTRKHAKDASTAITWAHQARKARQARDHASTLFRKLYFCQCNFCLFLSCRNTFLNKFPIAASRNQFSVYLLKQYSFIWRFFMLVEIQFLKNNIFRANENWFSG